MGRELLISKAGIKAFLKKQDLRVSSDFYDAINKEIIACLARAVKRAKGNNRLTVYARDV